MFVVCIFSVGELYPMLLVKQNQYIQWSRPVPLHFYSYDVAPPTLENGAAAENLDKHF